MQWLVDCFFLFCFVLLCYVPTAMVMAGRPVYLTTHLPEQAWTSSKPVLCAHTFACIWQQPFLNDSAEGRRMTIEIISWSISTIVWDPAVIKLAAPGSEVRLASVARHITDCATRPSLRLVRISWNQKKLVYIIKKNSEYHIKSGFTSSNIIL